MSSKVSSEDNRQQIRVAIIGAGISGLALANGLLKDESQRFQVSVYERDQIAYELDRGGYQLRMAAGGIEALKACLDLDTWNELQRAWAGDDAKAPSMVDPKSMTVHLNLAEVKSVPQESTHCAYRSEKSSSDQACTAQHCEMGTLIRSL